MDLKIYVLRITTTVAFLRLFLPSVINDRATTASSQTAGNTLWTLRWLWGGFSRTRTASLKEKHLCRAGGWFPLYNRSCLGSGDIKSIKPNQCRKSVQVGGPFFGQWRDQNHTNGFVSQEFDWMMFEKKVRADAKKNGFIFGGGSFGILMGLSCRMSVHIPTTSISSLHVKGISWPNKEKHALIILWTKTGRNSL